MSPRLSLPLILALVGCPEQGFREDLPNFEAGNPRPVESETHTDIVTQTVNPVIDVLFMIDNSCSMGDDQALLAENAPKFMRHFLGSGLDYHIGVVSSDIVNPAENGKLQGSGSGSNRKLWIETSDEGQIPRFVQMAVLGNGGAFPEKGIAAIFRSFVELGDTFNDGFIRDRSALHTVVVSDEFDYTEPGIVPLGEFINWYDGLRRTADERTFSAIEWPNARSYAANSKRYGAVTKSIGGVLWDIKDGDWSPALDILGLRATGLKSEYFLSKLPVEDSIEVTIRTPIPGTNDFSDLPQQEAERNADGMWVNGDWYYTPIRNSITFTGDVPTELAQIAITYTVASSVVSEQL